QVDTIEFVGVWDTVDAYGLPIDELTAGIDKFVWPLSMPDQTLSKKVLKACHAVALDDERNTFHPVLWDEAKETTSLTATQVEEERISQVWFAGVHSNVGGGDADDALSYVSFKWMADQARLRGLLFSEGLLAYHIAKADVLGRIYDSRRGLAGYYRYNPRKIEWLTNGQVHEQRLFGGRWPKPSPPVTVPRPKIHQSVLERIVAAPEAYAPIGFPARYAVVTNDGRILDGPEHPLETEAVSQARVLAQETVWDLVWWRRLAYFSAVAVTLVVLARPFRDGAAAAAETVEPDAAGRAVAALGGLLPDLASPWVKYYTANPRELAIGLFLLLALMMLGRRLQSRICGRMRGLWLRVAANPSAAFEAPRSLLFRIHSHALYQGAFAVLRRKLLPGLTGIGALLFLVVLAVRAPFHVAEAAGRVCDASSGTAGGTLGSLVRFASKDPCTATGVQIKKGKRYQISLELPREGEEAWKDSNIPVSSPAGFTSGSPELSLFQRAIFTLSAPFRRVVNADWFVPVARIGRSGPEFQLKASPAQFTAPASGELFLFVNDAILPPWQFFYGNNHGTATATVTEVAEEPGP
ncbi:MAG: phospholipase effector Tle1 domain-containing protein, partial [Thermoanaerobaculia bacterium]